MRARNFTSFGILLITLLGILVGIALVNRQAIYQLFTEASGVKANLVIETSGRYSEGPYIWKNLAQGGEETNPQTLSPLVSQLKELSPNYIRIDHIYDFYEVVKRKDNGSIFYDWSKLDVVVDDILEAGAKPFFSLSYMPSAFSSGKETDIPSNWGDWESLVKETINHYSGRNNRAIEDVYYEVWNEPDLFGNFKTSGSKNYLDMYLHSSKGAQAATNTLPYKLGGPATTNYYHNWMVGLLNFATENNLPLDFISWHQYTRDLSEFEKNIKSANDLLKGYTQLNTEIIISEWGHNSNVDKGYDEYFGAIHTLAGVSLMESMSKNTRLQPMVDKAFLFEIKDGKGPEQFWGRWGLYTHESFGTPIAKSREKALRFLNTMKGETLKVLGQGTWVRSFGTVERDIIRVLVTNYDPLGTHTEVVPMRFINLEADSYRVNRIDFQGKRRSFDVEPVSGVWAAEEYFAPNTSAIFELIPL